MQAVRPPPNIRTYAILLDGLCKNGELEEAMALFHNMEEKKLQLNIVIYNTLIGGTCKAGNLAAAKDLFCKLSFKGIQRDVRTYGIMIDGLLSGGLLGEALNLKMKWWPREDVSTCELFVDLISKGELDASLQLVGLLLSIVPVMFVFCKIESFPLSL
ncbi:hypothetical protein TIFTF001_028846 [Ficus carica]|uniref:Pentatricopeptide repeat-containing protein n=1 Tax=Ficus carica TaxID=3494 RepID=A0AA88DQQ6_FICCA|nr:hypothetical protein TIFTF001_028846 [Ficus carica]